mmetsp:Transcript_97817/g.272259  ORF Transcript_97817/g.272259 Transcript_97817/m.272259 type:complete len:159 (+) Transcript_97817:69-545(+)
MARVLAALAVAVLAAAPPGAHAARWAQEIAPSLNATAQANATRLQKGPAPALNATTHASAAAAGLANVPRFVEVKLGPFNSAADACDYCFGSFTKEGVPPAGPVAPACVCMAYPDAGAFNMFCATPVSAAGYIAEKGGCRCKGRDMEHMAATTCEPIS